jgi:2-isopropylmalate synthase
MSQVLIYDTTLRDGAQTEGVSFSVEDKVKIARKLDELGFHYLEGGWPIPANPTDVAFFERLAREPLGRAKLVAFGSTRRARSHAREDANLSALLKAKPQAVALVAKSWDLHVTQALRVTLKVNLEMIADSVGFAKEHGVEVFLDAEHFFDGFKHNPEYALKTLEVAQKSGADWICLCDTNGGSLPEEVRQGVRAAKKAVKLPLAIHAHNDGELAVANSLAAVGGGVRMVQGTINGYGERCGNANLCSLLPNLQLKLGLECLSEEALARLYECSHYVDEVANMAPAERQPFVGRSAFAHKAGYHVDAVLKQPETYEHIAPGAVGNERRLLVSGQAGGSAIVFKARGLELDLDKGSPETQEILRRVKEMEHEGYQFEAAEASLELLMKKALGLHRPWFDLEEFRVIIEKHGSEDAVAEATIKLVVSGEEEHTAAEGDGPVHALDNALRKALERFYPSLAQIKLTDYKVRVVDVASGTAAKVRVLVESSDGRSSWSTVGVHSNIIEASWQAFVDGIEFGLSREEGDGKAG